MLKKGKRFLSLLCCIALISSMTLDVCAADVSSLTAGENRTQVTADERAESEISSIRETEKEERTSRSETLPNTEAASEQEKEEGSESESESEDSGTEKN